MKLRIVIPSGCLIALALVGCINTESSELTTVSKRIAITIDDAPMGGGPLFSGQKRTTQLIQALDDAEVTASFYVVTRNFDKPRYKARIQQYADVGHDIANHSHTHLAAHNVSFDEYAKDVDTAIELLKSHDQLQPWYRAPYLSDGREHEKREQFRAYLAKRDLINAYVTVDNADWYIAKQLKDAVKRGDQVNYDALKAVYIKLLVDAANFYNQLALDHIGRSPAHTLLLHENDLAALFMADLVKALKDDGWQLITTAEAYQDPIASIEAKTLHTKDGRVAALAVDNGASIESTKHYSSDYQAIDELLLANKVFNQTTH